MLWILAPLFLAFAAAAAFGLLLLVRFVLWAWRCGSRVVVPWTIEDLPQASRFADRRRTRDGDNLVCKDTSHCELVFFKRVNGKAWEPAIRDAITGFTGIETIAADFALERGGERWLITSTSLKLQRLTIDGPHYEPKSAGQGSAIARVDLAGQLDVGQFRTDLMTAVADSRIRHQSAAWAFIVGRADRRRVTCSGLIGNAILRQPASQAALALRRSLSDRYTYGEITPADLARAAALLRLADPQTAEPFRVEPLMAPLRAFGYLAKPSATLAAGISPDILK
ncbi:MAG: hypothetical protein ABL995_02960 [Bryobacteraceae bacterium]